MESYNSFLRRLSLPKMLWVSLSLTATHLRVLLPLVLLFCLPVDLLSDWIGEYVISSSYPKATANLFLCLQMTFYSVFSGIGYVAIAWEVREIIEGETPSVSKALSTLAGRTLGRLFATILYSYWRIFWPLLAFVAVFVPSAIFLSLSLNIFLPVYVLGILVCLPFVVRNGLNYTLLIFPTLFENRYFSAAAQRSKLLVSGRRVWLFFVFVGQIVLAIAATAIVTVLLPGWLKWPESNPHHLIGLLRSIYDSVTSSLVLAVIVILDTLIYFQLRRQKNDLTFFDLSSTAVLEPAGAIPKAQ